MLLWCVGWTDPVRGVVDLVKGVCLSRVSLNFWSKSPFYNLMKIMDESVII